MSRRRYRGQENLSDSQRLRLLLSGLQHGLIRHFRAGYGNIRPVCYTECMPAKGLVFAIMIGTLTDAGFAQPKIVEPPKSPDAGQTRQTSRQSSQLGSGVYYRNCDAARAAGAAPIRAGQPGYRPGLDRDGDGIACEPYRGR